MPEDIVPGGQGALLPVCPLSGFTALSGFFPIGTVGAGFFLGNLPRGGFGFFRRGVVFVGGFLRGTVFVGGFLRGVLLVLDFLRGDVFVVVFLREDFLIVVFLRGDLFVPVF